VVAPLLVTTLTAASPAYPSVIPLPVDWAPEGVATANNTFYSGSSVDGSIFRGDLRSGEGAVFIHQSGRSALGLKVDTRHGLLFVAGGFTGHAYVYDLRSGDDVADYTLAPEGELINDVVVTTTAAYFTDTFAPRIYKVPITPDGSLGPAQTITVTGPASAVGGFGMNGIDATPDGSTLVVCLTTLGTIATVDPETGASDQITVTSGSLVPGTPDGILLAGHDLWVVENFANTVARVHLSPDLSTGAVTDTVTNSAFEVPTTIARHGTRLVVVNGKFDLGFPPPLGPGAPPGTPFEAVQFTP
jgi:sugar lactone lactonase YvrE